MSCAVNLFEQRYSTNSTRTYVRMHVHTYEELCVYLCIDINIYIYRERERCRNLCPCNSHMYDVCIFCTHLRISTCPHSLRLRPRGLRHSSEKVIGSTCAAEGGCSLLLLALEGPSRYRSFHIGYVYGACWAYIPKLLQVFVEGLKELLFGLDCCGDPVRSEEHTMT